MTLASLNSALPLADEFRALVFVVQAEKLSERECGGRGAGQTVAGLLRRPPLSGNATLVIDGTGVGRPVTDLFKRAGLRPKSITITGGDSESSVGDGQYRVSKLLLVSRLQALLHSGELRIAADLPEAKTLVHELQDFRTSFSDNGVARFGAREGAHDDLVLAVAIGAYWACRPTGGAVDFSWSTGVIRFS